MSEPLEDAEPAPPRAIKPAAAFVVLGGLLAVVAGAAVAFNLLKGTSPPPAEIASDPLLVSGRGVYLDRCLSCHGPTGKGDGPIARGLSGPPVGDLTDGTWKHGDHPDQVRAVIAQGVPSASMPGWGRTLSPDDVRAVTAYVYHLAGREVPAALRSP